MSRILGFSAASAVETLGAKGVPAWFSWEPPGVFTLEARLGPAYRSPGHTVFAVFQVLDARWPNLGLLRVIERRDGDGSAVQDPTRPIYDRALDVKVSTVLTPVLNTLLNPMDPTGAGRSLHVGCFHGRVAPARMPGSAAAALTLMRRFRRDGQLAVIWTDFHDPPAVLAIRATRSLIARSDVHLIPRTDEPSALQTSWLSSDGVRLAVGGMSTAVDQGLELARHYLTIARSP